MLLIEAGHWPTYGSSNYWQCRYLLIEPARVETRRTMVRSPMKLHFERRKKRARALEGRESATTRWMKPQQPERCGRWSNIEYRRVARTPAAQTTLNCCTVDAAVAWHHRRTFNACCHGLFSTLFYVSMAATIPDPSNICSIETRLIVLGNEAKTRTWYQFFFPIRQHLQRGPLARRRPGGEGLANLRSVASLC